MSRLSLKEKFITDYKIKQEDYQLWLDEQAFLTDPVSSFPAIEQAINSIVTTEYPLNPNTTGMGSTLTTIETRTEATTDGWYYITGEEPPRCDLYISGIWQGSDNGDGDLITDPTQITNMPYVLGANGEDVTKVLLAEGSKRMAYVITNPNVATKAMRLENYNDFLRIGIGISDRYGRLSGITYTDIPKHWWENYSGSVYFCSSEDKGDWWDISEGVFDTNLGWIRYQVQGMRRVSQLAIFSQDGIYNAQGFLQSGRLLNSNEYTNLSKTAMSSFSFKYDFDSTTTNGTINTSSIKINNSDPVSATMLWISETDKMNVDIDQFLDGFRHNNYIMLTNKDGSKYHVYKMSAQSFVSGEGIDSIPIEYMFGTALIFDDGEEIAICIERTPDATHTHVIPVNSTGMGATIVDQIHTSEVSGVVVDGWYAFNDEGYRPGVYLSQETNTCLFWVGFVQVGEAPYGGILATKADVVLEEVKWYYIEDTHKVERYETGSYWTIDVTYGEPIPISSFSIIALPPPTPAECRYFDLIIGGVRQNVSDIFYAEQITNQPYVIGTEDIVEFGAPDLYRNWNLPFYVKLPKVVSDNTVTIKKDSSLRLFLHISQIEGMPSTVQRNTWWVDGEQIRFILTNSAGDYLKIAKRVQVPDYPDRIQSGIESTNLPILIPDGNAGTWGNGADYSDSGASSRYTLKGSEFSAIENSVFKPLGFRPKIRTTQATTDSNLEDDYTILLDASLNTIDFSLTPILNAIFNIKCINADNTVTIVGTIDADTNQTMTLYQTINLHCDGTNFYKI